MDNTDLRHERTHSAIGQAVTERLHGKRSKQDTARYQGLISQAKMHEYYATCATNGLSTESRERWAASAAKLRAEAEAIPDDFVDPPFVMPAWGTYGT